MARRRKQKKSQLKDLNNFTRTVYGPGPCNYMDFCLKECTSKCENYPDLRAMEIEMEEEERDL